MRIFINPRIKSVIIKKTQKKTKELHSETLIRKLHFKGSLQIHGFKRWGADLVTTMTSV